MIRQLQMTATGLTRTGRPDIDSTTDLAHIVQMVTAPGTELESLGNGMAATRAVGGFEPDSTAGTVGVPLGDPFPAGVADQGVNPCSHVRIHCIRVRKGIGLTKDPSLSLAGEDQLVGQEVLPFLEGHLRLIHLSHDPRGAESRPKSRFPENIDG